jgi:DNA-directed RNA polymerase specialized sigma24 family protein
LGEEHSLGRGRLMERAQRGDREAFHRLFEDVGPFIGRFLRRRIGDNTELEDICQETMIRSLQVQAYLPTRAAVRALALCNCSQSER